MDNIVYIGLGSNVGDRESHLRFGVSALEQDQNCKVVETSSIYETAPVGYIDQGPFLNMVVVIKTTFKADEVLSLLLNIEKRAKRSREIRWGPRTLDLDILLYNQENIKMDVLQVPHPRMAERAFVIVPLHEVNPNLYLSNKEQTVEQIYGFLPDKEGVKIWRRRNGEEKSVLFES
ncbi:2-amino-4-hydroxy-6-hydroxymethyldihydropteridine diphosphokinase [Alkalihalobacillus sp. LMS39]|uniref:2-amino-4-hydroxy-6- hydroxymethyldihydropteridine diphosphokinase n=1 Tax=Alkalihalobacillus sp. LMS39 TaxID=2924032 RepID=UPI001FB51E0A|nr:2-amino-4-hydroxy-6-hydroxymethyldihydropteridine diphosphokinase [Alkalihalobacillus sp. LMS39]UOE94216.1 2-amino-4-hydroxy-6-hydroxymethyldihydropteridine diphosphokinase [Alkalihalobacillus sp. LMS39]